MNSTRLSIPFITVTDSVNGILLVNGTLFPATMGEEQISLGVNWVLSPELDLALDPRNGRVGEM
jgi:beta-glucosidase